MHTDATAVGYGGTLHTSDMQPAVESELQGQGVWSWQERAKGITYREVKAVCMFLIGPLVKTVKREEMHDILVHIDNQAVTHIVNEYVSSSRMMI